LKVIIIGAGEVGFNVASRFALENKDVVVIDIDAAAIRNVSENIDVQVLQGSGSSPVLLEEAGIKEADILLAVTDSDEVNLVACLAADILSPTTKKLARLRSADYDPYHGVLKEKAPRIDTIINPEIEVVKSIDRLMSIPGAADIGEFADGRVKVVGVYIDADAPLAGIQLSDYERAATTVRPLIAAIIRNERLIIPAGGDVLRTGDLAYFISERESLVATLKLFGKHAEKVRRVLIVGGGRIGYRLAAHLETQDIYVKIIEKAPQRCLFLSEHLNKAVILNGDGSDQQLLQEENIQEMDAVVTLTSDEETNILVSLLAKQMGARKAITKISKFSYFPLMKAIGIERVVSPRLSAINTILQHIRKGKVLSAIAIKGEQAEVLEAVALETSDIVGIPLKNLSFPKDALVIGIIRNDEVLIPTGESIIMPNDRIIIFATRLAVPKVEKILSVKLEYF
jgi:trk system potassium uptake protein TrkA